MKGPGNRSLRTRLFSTIAGSLFVVGGLTMAIEYRHQYGLHVRQTRAALEEQGRTLRVMWGETKDRTTVQRMVDTFCAQMNEFVSPGHHILLLDPNGSVAVRAHQHSGRRVEEALLNAPADAAVLRVPGHRLAQYRLRDDDGSQLVMAQYLDHMEGLLRGQVWRRAVALGLMALASLACIWWAVATWVVRPLEQVTGAIRQWARHDLSARAVVDGPTEFQLLAREFNGMAGRLGAQEARRKRELDQARHIQKSLLPHRKVKVPGLRVAAAYLPAAQVAGDLYDVFPLPGGRTAVAILDVCGHGISAALLTGAVKMSLHRWVESAATLSEALARVNDDVMDCSPDDIFVTALVGIWHPRDHTWDYVAAGHPGGLHLNCRRVHRIPTTAPLLGVMPSAEFPVQRLTLARDERLFLYTDGLIEVHTADRCLTIEYLIDLIVRSRGLGLEYQTRHIVNHVSRLAGKALQDDITLVALERSGRKGGRFHG